MKLDYEKARSIKIAADMLGVSPVDLATVIAYETIGSFDPGIAGGANKDGSGRGTYKGLIQFSPWNQKHYGVKPGMSFHEQITGPVVNYLKGEGVKPGMGINDIYSTVLTGAPGNYNRRDINGSVLQHVGRMQKNYTPRIQQVFDVLGSQDAATQGYISGLEEKGNRAALPVDTSLQGLFSTPSLPGIDGETPNTNEGIPVARRDNPANPSFADNAVGNLVNRDTGQPLPRTVQEMLSGAPEGSFLEGGPVERMFAGQVDPLPASPSIAVTQGRDLPNLMDVLPLEAVPTTAVTRGSDLPALDTSSAFDRFAAVQPTESTGLFLGGGNTEPEAVLTSGPTQRLGPRGQKDVPRSVETQSIFVENPMVEGPQAAGRDFGETFGLFGADEPTVTTSEVYGGPVDYVSPFPAGVVEAYQQYAASRAPQAKPEVPPTVAQAMSPTPAAVKQGYRQNEQSRLYSPVKTVQDAVDSVTRTVNQYGGTADPGEGWSYGYSPYGSGVSKVHDSASDQVKIAASGPGLFGAFKDDFGIDLEPFAKNGLIAGAGTVAAPGLMTGGFALGGLGGAQAAGLLPTGARLFGRDRAAGLFGDPFSDQLSNQRQNRTVNSNLSGPERTLRRGLAAGVDYASGGMWAPSWGQGGNQQTGRGLFGGLGNVLGGLFGSEPARQEQQSGRKASSGGGLGSFLSGLFGGGGGSRPGSYDSLNNPGGTI